MHGQDLLWELSLPELFSSQGSWPTPRLSSPWALKASVPPPVHLCWCTLFSGVPTHPHPVPLPWLFLNLRMRFPATVFPRHFRSDMLLVSLTNVPFLNKHLVYFWSRARCIAWGICLRTLVSSSSCQVIQPLPYDGDWTAFLVLKWTTFFSTNISMQ